MSVKVQFPVAASFVVSVQHLFVNCFYFLDSFLQVRLALVLRYFAEIQLVGLFV